MCMYLHQHHKLFKMFLWVILKQCNFPWRWNLVNHYLLLCLLQHLRHPKLPKMILREILTVMKMITYTCEKCGHISTSPIQHRDHIYFHKETQFTCGRYYRSFPSVSQLNLHCHLHKRQRLYNCFSPNCKKGYKWPQDLLWHIKMHLPINHRCLDCDYNTPEKRLFVQHLRVHMDERPFACRKCRVCF